MAITPKKNILVLTPDTPHPSYIAHVLHPLGFLEEHYQLHPLDSLEIMDDLPNDAFYHLWNKKLVNQLPLYDAFIGFSFGGVILQQCFSLFTHIKKPIILFSTPTFAHRQLTNSLQQVVSLCENLQIETAMEYLYQLVYYPHEPPKQSHRLPNKAAAAKRVIYGLNRVLTTDSRAVLNQNQVNYVHLIGEQSRLVNKDNVIVPPSGTLLNVPNAGMRVLRDNPVYCQKVIWEALNHEAS